MSAVEKKEPISSAMFIFLNKTCFRGIHREGPNGFNVPYGNYKNPSIFDEDHILQVSRLLQGVQFKVCSYTEVLCEVEDGDFVYLDPPYAPLNSNSFVGYTKDGFKQAEHDSLFQACRSLTERGGRFLMSNANVPMVVHAFNDDSRYVTKVIQCRRAIHSKNPGSSAEEVLISSDPRTANAREM